MCVYEVSVCVSMCDVSASVCVMCVCDVSVYIYVCV